MSKTPELENKSFRKISSIQKSTDGRNGNGDQTPKAVTPIPQGLMWAPKVNKKGLENFLNNERFKHNFFFELYWILDSDFLDINYQEI